MVTYGILTNISLNGSYQKNALKSVLVFLAFDWHGIYVKVWFNL